MDEGDDQSDNQIGPQDHGRHMSLTEYEPVQVRSGFRYELGRGVIVVTDFPRMHHLFQVYEIRKQLAPFEVMNPQRPCFPLAPGECKILLRDFQSERHPDLTIYLTNPLDEDYPWATWVPEIIVEVVSADSVTRDYVEKREEYLAFGVREYWIVDSDKRQVLILQRSRGTWVERVLQPGDMYETKLLPGFRFDCQKVFEAAEKAEN
jgi:hypothetical protein